MHVSIHVANIKKYHFKMKLKCIHVHVCFLFFSQSRLTAYRQFVSWMFRGEKLGKGKRVVIPACVVRKIRLTFPEPDGQYTGFQTAFDSTQDMFWFYLLLISCVYKILVKTFRCSTYLSDQNKIYVRFLLPDWPYFWTPTLNFSGLQKIKVNFFRHW